MSDSNKQLKHPTALNEGEAFMHKGFPAIVVRVRSIAAGSLWEVTYRRGPAHSSYPLEHAEVFDGSLLEIV